MEKPKDPDLGKHHFSDNHVSGQETILTCLEIMKDFRSWSESTYESYVRDVQTYEQYLWNEGIEPLLDNSRLYMVQKWTKDQLNQNISVSTIRRRLATLSSIYSFYKDLGIVSSNAFKAVDVPVGEKGHFSAVMDFEQLKQVYRYLHKIKETSIDMEITTKTMIFTGLRNESLTKLKVDDLFINKQLLRYNAGIVNSKHKLQFFPLPPKLFDRLQVYIRSKQLQPADNLLYGINGQALKNKQLNRITNKICKDLGWEKEERVTPHGFRATLATLLDERGVDLDCIKYLLGHSNQDNVHYYLRRDQRKINRLRHELTLLEEQLENSLSEEREGKGESNLLASSTIVQESEPKPQISEDILLHLLDTHPQLAISLIQKGYTALAEKQ